MKKVILFFILLVLTTGHLLAQNRTVTGKVTDEAGHPLGNVSITVKGQTIGTTSADDGTYSLAVPRNVKVLQFSSVGLTTQEINVGNAGIINAALTVQSNSLNEVVVTAVGITRVQKTLGYSTTTLRSEDLLKARETNVVNSLAGKVAGVRVNTQSGTLGGSAKIIIRGANSLDGNNSPIFVVDGLPIDNSTGLGGTTTNNVDYGNKAGDINPDDIESMTVLKSASATALYGARAKNGAIIITTKKGKKNAQAAVSINSSVRVDNVLKLPEFQNDYAQGNYGVYNLKYTNGWGPKIADVQDKKFKDFLGDSVTLAAQPNNVKDFFQTGLSYLNNISFAGGGDNSDYRLSISSLNEKGVIPETKLDRYTIALNAGREFSSKLSSRMSISYIKTNAEGRPSQSSNNSNILTSAIYGIPRVVDINKLKNNFINPVTGEQIFLSTDKTGNNPYWIMNYNKNNNSVDRVVGNFVLNYKPLSWLSISNNLGGDIYTEQRVSVTRKGTAGTINGQFNTADLFVRTLNNDFLVTADKNITKDLGVKLILGHNINEREARTTSVLANNLTIDQLYTYSNASSTTPGLAYSKKRIVGVFGDLGFSYKNFAYLNVTGRNDWSSTLPIQNRSYFYPSVSGSFIYSEFTKNWNWLNFGKLRASWASVGSDEQPYQLDFLYTPVTTVFLQYVGTNTAFPSSPINTAFTGPQILPPANLQPQQQQSFEVGTDLKMFQNRVGLNVTYYDITTKNQIVALDVPISTGYFSNKVNVGSVRNKGIEIDLNLQPVKTKDFAWAIDLNFARNRQVVEKLSASGTLKQYSLASGWSGLQILAEEGKTFGLYGTGWMRDSPGNLVIDANTGLRKTIAKKRFGDTSPEWTMGINNTFTYKGFSISALIDIRKGGVFYSGTVSNLRTSGLAKETLVNRDKVFIEKGVVFDGTKYVTNTVPVQSMQDYWAWEAATSNTEGNVFDASFVKFRELRFAYALPKSMFKANAFFKSVEFGIEGRNLLIIKDYVPHVDPELNFFGSSSTGEGVEFNSIPTTRSAGFNVRVTF